MFQKELIPFSEQQKCHITNIYTVEVKQKYRITLFCVKNKSILLHHVLALLWKKDPGKKILEKKERKRKLFFQENSPGNVFNLAYVVL